MSEVVDEPVNSYGVKELRISDFGGCFATHYEFYEGSELEAASQGDIEDMPPDFPQNIVFAKRLVIPATMFLSSSDPLLEPFPHLKEVKELHIEGFLPNVVPVLKRYSVETLKITGTQPTSDDWKEMLKQDVNLEFISIDSTHRFNVDMSDGFVEYIRTKKVMFLVLSGFFCMKDFAVLLKEIQEAHRNKLLIHWLVNIANEHKYFDFRVMQKFMKKHKKIMQNIDKNTVNSEEKLKKVFKMQLQFGDVTFLFLNSAYLEWKREQKTQRWANLCTVVFVIIAERYRLVIIPDEIYGDLVYDDATFYPLASLSPKVPVICCDGLAKRWIVPGWRMGWIIVHDRFGVVTEVKKGLTSLSHRINGSCNIVQGSLPKILKEIPEEYFEYTRQFISGNAKIVSEALKDFPGIELLKPQGAMYVMIGIDSELYGDDVTFTHKLIQEESLILFPGTPFLAPGWIRLVITSPEEEILEAVDRIKAFCNRMNPAAAQDQSESNEDSSDSNEDETEK